MCSTNLPISAAFPSNQPVCAADVPDLGLDKIVHEVHILAVFNQ